jgi:hypothetical protein
MSDSSDSTKALIPDWQRATPSPPSNEPSSEQKLSPSDDSPASRSALIEQASRFLEEESIRDAPIDRKISFLESKGLQNDEIQKLLGVSRNPEVSSKTEATPSETPKGASEPSASKSNLQTSQSLSPQSKVPSQPSRDIPPVITYPEFLLQAQKPPPLITAHCLLYTLYLTGGLAAALYGTGKYLVAPMIESLTSARHELAETAQTNLAKLNEKLTANVSKIPPSSLQSHPHATNTDAEDAESITSDPTELFHRDMATQTTPTMTRSPSPSSASSSQSQELPKKDITISHTQRLNVIHLHLSEFVAGEDAAVTSMEENKEVMSELQSYLDTLIYGSVNSGYSNGMYGSLYSGGGYDGGSGQGKEAEDDAVAQFKAEIRGVKGALLSARNFPSGAPGKVR